MPDNPIHDKPIPDNHMLDIAIQDISTKYMYLYWYMDL